MRKLAISVCLAVSLLAPMTPNSPATSADTPTAFDATLQNTATHLLPKLAQVTHRYAAQRTWGSSDTDTYIKAVKSVLRRYRNTHPGSPVREDVSLFSKSAPADITTNTTLDWLSQPQLFGPAHFSTITWDGKTIYRVYSTPVRIPKLYWRHGFRGSLAVYRVIHPGGGTGSGTAGTPPQIGPLDRLQGEIAITRQITGWAIYAAPSDTDRSVLQGFDVRLESFGRTVFEIQHRGDPSAVYSGPGFPPPQVHPFKDNLEAIKGELGAARASLADAVAAVSNPTDKETLEQGGKIFDDLEQAVNALEAG